MKVYLKSFNCDIFFVIFPVCGFLEILRTGAWHPLPNLSGCQGTRGTRSNDVPDYEITT